MRSHLRRGIVFIVAGVLLGAAAGCERAAPQRAVFTEVAQRMNAVERFAGEVRVRTSQGEQAVRVDVRTWNLGGGVKLDELPLQVRGMLIAQLRGGRLTTVIEGSRQQRREGEYWTVPSGVRMGLETEDDSAILQTIVIVQP